MNHVQHINESTFEAEVLDSTEPVLVDFYAQWCPPCKMLAPILDHVANEFTGVAKVVKVDVDQASTLAQLLRIQSLPTLVLFKNGHEVERIVGVQSAQVLGNKLRQHVQPQARTGVTRQAQADQYTEQLRWQ